MKHAIQIEQEAGRWAKTAISIHQHAARSKAAKAVWQHLRNLPAITEPDLDAAVATLKEFATDAATRQDLKHLEKTVKQFKTVLADQAAEKEVINAAA